jgi:hypothetical protein
MIQHPLEHFRAPSLPFADARGIRDLLGGSFAHLLPATNYAMHLLGCRFFQVFYISMH